MRLTKIAVKLTAGMVCLLLSNLSCETVDKGVVCLIPQGFTGIVVIIFEQPGGTVSEIEGGKKVYRIPANGVLRTQDRPRYAVASLDYFYVDSSGARTPIPWLTPKEFEEITSNPDAVSRHRQDIFAYGDEIGGTADNLPDRQTFRTFIVSELERSSEMFHQRNTQMPGIRR